jgi:hypothetical protein
MPLSNPLLLEVLERARRLSSPRAFAPLHESARLTYAHAFTPALEQALKAALGHRAWRLEQRHSAAHGRRFNVFSSDVDYAFVLAADFDLPRLPRLVELYGRARRALPFIGEVEIYYDEEWRLKQRLRNAQARVLDLIWSLRKIGWQEDAMAAAHSRYHAGKSLDSIQRLLDGLGPGLRARPAGGNLAVAAPAVTALLESWFGEAETGSAGGAIWTGTTFDARSDYLRARLTTRHISPASGSEPPLLPLSLNGCLLLSALLPDADSFSGEGSSGTPSWLERLRARPDLRRAYVAVTANEILLNRSVSRLQGRRLSASSEAWLELLAERLKRHDLEHEVELCTRKIAFPS